MPTTVQDPMLAHVRSAAAAPAREQIRVVPLERGHVDGVMALFGRRFGKWCRRRVESRWAWLRDENPWRGKRAAKSWVGVTGNYDRVVAHLGAIPLPLRFAKSPRVALGAWGFVADASARGIEHDLAAALVGEAPIIAGAAGEFGAAISRRGCPILPLSRRRYTMALRNTGARVVDARRHVGAALAPLVRPWMVDALPGAWRAGALTAQRVLDAERDLHLEPLAAFGPEYDDLWREASGSIACTIERDGAYMAWRYTRCPGQRPILVAARDPRGRLVGVGVAVRRVQLDDAGRPVVGVGEVTEVIAPPERPDVARALLAGLVLLLDRERVEAVTAGCPRRSLRPALKDVGFIERESDEGALGVMPGIRGTYLDAWMGEEHWSISSADADALYFLAD